jgi:hypothetical protein
LRYEVVLASANPESPTGGEDYSGEDRYAGKLPLKPRSVNDQSTIKAQRAFAAFRAIE